MPMDYYLKLDGVPGESTKDGVVGEIELLSWSWSEAQTGTQSHGTGGGSGRVAFQDFHFSMTMCKASPVMFLKCATGEHIPKGVLTCRKAGTTQQVFYTATFTNIVVSSYQVGGSPGDDALPTDQCSFNFEQVEIVYQQQDKAGAVGQPVKAGYNVKNLKKV